MALPEVDGVTVLVDSLISWPGSWRLYLRATPQWWKYGEDLKWTPVSVHAQDELGGTYVSTFGGSTGPWPRGYEELALGFLPRLSPLARALRLTFRGATAEVPVDLSLGSGASSPPD